MLLTYTFSCSPSNFPKAHHSRPYKTWSYRNDGMTVLTAFQTTLRRPYNISLLLCLLLHVILVTDLNSTRFLNSVRHYWVNLYYLPTCVPFPALHLFIYFLFLSQIIFCLPETSLDFGFRENLLATDCLTFCLPGKVVFSFSLSGVFSDCRLGPQWLRSGFGICGFLVFHLLLFLLGSQRTCLLVFGFCCVFSLSVVCPRFLCTFACICGRAGEALSCTAQLWALPSGFRPPLGQRWGRGCSRFPVTSVVPAKRGSLSPALGAAQFHAHVGKGPNYWRAPLPEVGWGHGFREWRVRWVLWESD